MNANTFESLKNPTVNSIGNMEGVRFWGGIHTLACGHAAILLQIRARTVYHGYVILLIPCTCTINSQHKLVCKAQKCHLQLSLPGSVC